MQERQICVPFTRKYVVYHFLPNQNWYSDIVLTKVLVERCDNSCCATYLLPPHRQSTTCPRFVWFRSERFPFLRGGFPQASGSLTLCIIYVAAHLDGRQWPDDPKPLSDLNCITTTRDSGCTPHYSYFHMPAVLHICTPS
jgi:hypothetical protein